MEHIELMTGKDRRHRIIICRYVKKRPGLEGKGDGGRRRQRNEEQKRPTKSGAKYEEGKVEKEEGKRQKVGKGKKRKTG